MKKKSVFKRAFKLFYAKDLLYYLLVIIVEVLIIYLFSKLPIYMDSVIKAINKFDNILFYYSGRYFVFYALIITLMLFSKLFRNYIFTYRVERRIYKSLILHLFSINYNDIQLKNAGEWNSYFNNFIPIAVKSVAVTVPLIIIVVRGFFIFLILFHLNKMISFIVMFILFFYIVNLELIKNKRSQKFNEVYDSFMKIGGEISFLFQNFIDIRNFNLHKFYENKFFKSTRGFRDKFYNFVKIENFVVTFDNLIGIGLPVIVIFIYYLFLGNETSTNVYSIFSVIFLLIPMFHSISEIRTEEIHGRAAWMNIFDLLDKSSEQKEGISSDKLDILITNLSINFGSNPILQDINLKIKAGEKVFIAGKSGSGKSTLLRSIIGLMHLAEGNIIIGNVNINEIDRNEYWNNIAYLKHNPILFNDTLYNNLAIADNTLTESFIAEQLKKIGLKKHVDSLNNKVNFDGSIFSSGEKIRINLLQNLFKRPGIIIIDEALSYIDSLQESKIVKALMKMKKTIVMVSHRESSLKYFNRLICLDDGKIIYDGNPHLFNKDIESYLIQGENYEQKEK